MKLTYLVKSMATTNKYELLILTLINDACEAKMQIISFIFVL